MLERDLAELADRVGLAGGNDEVIRLSCCSMSHIASDVVGRPSPVSPRLEVAKSELGRSGPA